MTLSYISRQVTRRKTTLYRIPLVLVFSPKQKIHEPVRKTLSGCNKKEGALAFGVLAKKFRLDVSSVLGILLI